MKSWDFRWALCRSVRKGIIRSISSKNVNAYHLPNLEEEKLLIYMCRYYLFNEWFKIGKMQKTFDTKNRQEVYLNFCLSHSFGPH
jgi:hypothetical protein